MANKTAKQEMKEQPENEQIIEFRLSGLSCPDCAKGLGKTVSRIDGVKSCRLVFSASKIIVEGIVSREIVAKAIKDMGYKIVEEDKISSVPKKNKIYRGFIGFIQFLLGDRDTILALIGFVLVFPGLVFDELFPFLGISTPVFEYMAIAALIVAGYPVFISAFKNLFSNHEITMNLLMVIAGVGGVVIGAYTEAGLVMVLFMIGEALEGYTMEQSKDAIRKLMEVAPNDALVLRPCIDCEEHIGKDGYNGGPCPFCGPEEKRAPVEELVVGDRIIVKPGEKIPMDGIVISGSSSVDQAPITGESIPVYKCEEDRVFAGSINGEGALTIEVTNISSDNTISRMIRLVEEAQERKAPAERFVDRFAKYYTPVVIVLAILVASVPPIFFGAPFLNLANSTQGWLYRALELLVVACPCSLVISVPVTIVSAISNAARNGVLIKGGAYLEELSRTKIIAFDKTGTLTEGKPRVIKVKSENCLSCEGGDCKHCNDLLAIASSVESRSEHPLAQAILEEARARGIHAHYKPAENVMALSGKGVGGKVNGDSVFVGSHSFFDSNVPHDPQTCEEINLATIQGYTPLLVSIEGKYSGFITVADTVRDTSKVAVDRLKKMGIENLVMLTGDAKATAKLIAGQVGIEKVYSELLPEKKLDAIKDLMGSEKHVAMVGDGINDAPALAESSVGIAMGSTGTGQAMETSDVVLMSGDLSKLPFTFRISRHAMRTIYQNIAFSLAVKASFFVVVLLGFGTMWLAVLADVGVTFLVSLNGMRLLRFRDK